MAIYYTFYESLLYIWKTVVDWIQGVAKLAVYSKQGRMYSRMYSKLESLYISKSFPNNTLQHQCIECIVNFHKVHRVFNKNYTFLKGIFTYIETLRAFTIHSIHRAVQGEER